MHSIHSSIRSSVGWIWTPPGKNVHMNKRLLVETTDPPLTGDVAPVVDPVPHRSCGCVGSDVDTVSLGTSRKGVKRRLDLYATVEIGVEKRRVI